MYNVSYIVAWPFLQELIESNLTILGGANEKSADMCPIQGQGRDGRLFGFYIILLLTCLALNYGIQLFEIKHFKWSN